MPRFFHAYPIGKTYRIQVCDSQGTGPAYLRGFVNRYFIIVNDNRYHSYLRYQAPKPIPSHFQWCTKVLPRYSQTYTQVSTQVIPEDIYRGKSGEKFQDIFLMKNF